MILLWAVPVPFVAWSPGQTVDLAGRNGSKPVVQVSGLPARQTKGEVRMTTVSVTSVDSVLSFSEALVNSWLPDHDVLPRDVVYQPGLSNDEVRASEMKMMDTSQSDAVVAALRAAGQPVTEVPMAAGVSTSGPATNVMAPGDLIIHVDGRKVSTPADVQHEIRAHDVGEPVPFTVERNGKARNVVVTTTAQPDNPKIPLIGISVTNGYRYDTRVRFNLPEGIVGPSAGLMMSLATYQTIAPSDLVGDLRLAGTGTVAPDGTVSSIGGIQEKMAGAERDGAQVFLVPAGNCQDIAGHKTSMKLVKVTSLRDAIASVQNIRSGAQTKEVPHC